MSYAPVFDYLFATAKPKPYAIFRAFIIAHDSQDLERFRLWVDRLLEDHVPLLNKPAFIKKHFIRALTEAKTAPLIVDQLAIPDEVRGARTLPSPSPPGSQQQQQQEQQREQQMTWTLQAHHGQPQAQLLSQAFQIAGPGLSSTHGQIPDAGRERGYGSAPDRRVVCGRGRERGGP
ncbi:hypothetical protein K457DRAFT_23005 [Linnemannia elongata AG-77]|uniref:Uncharacterized protein n=1 Tax=Linnemannia elongata AG-77 TaxID=1314771 RepID=A0A197JKP4_9FUNG|nr:hypothetical protein K457DRAFT_23005 [Linnemannia elongata AG-77]